MNDREVLEALLEGKVIVDESTPWFEFHYRLTGDKIWIKYDEHKWIQSDHIPRLDSDYVRIEEEEERE